MALGALRIRVSAFDPIRELSENANAYTPLGPGDDRIVTDRYVLWLGRGDEPAWNVAQRFRLDAGEVDAVRAEIHRQLRARGRSGRLRRQATWSSGSSLAAWSTTTSRSRSGWC